MLGDWPNGAHIEIRRGILPQLADGAANIADVEYDVVLPSGGKVFNGASPNLAPFHFEADPTGPLNQGAMALVAALAAFEGLPVVLTDGTVNPDGTFVPKAP